jgi:DNA topoisomerase VI subunit A
MASSKGALIGDIVVHDVKEAQDIDCTRLGRIGLRVPSIIENDYYRFKSCKAKYLLLIEKEAVWHRLVEDGFWKKNHCLLLTGMGQPPRGVRRLCSRLVNELRLPLYVYTDNDPWGYYIYSVVKQGSINLAYESIRMAVPTARFLGLRAGDRERYKLPNDVCIKLDDEDLSRIKQIQDYPWFAKKPWQKELKEMKASGVKMEQEALSKKSISFVSEEYLPKKIRDRDFLD